MIWVVIGVVGIGLLGLAWWVRRTSVIVRNLAEDANYRQWAESTILRVHSLDHQSPIVLEMTAEDLVLMSRYTGKPPVDIVVKNGVARFVWSCP